ncbi:MAG: hypothetical protein JWQ71_2823 [Pedosphaera sp.]|nr:hypothetical protein [Pedosphaera sp.]
MGIDDEALDGDTIGISAANDDDAEAEFDGGIESASGIDEVIDDDGAFAGGCTGAAGAEVEGAGSADCCAAVTDHGLAGIVVEVEIHGGVGARGCAGQAASVGGEDRGIEGELGVVDGAAFFEDVRQDEDATWFWCAGRRGAGGGADGHWIEAEHGEVVGIGMGIYGEQLAIHGIGGGAGGEEHGETGFEVRVETAATAGNQIINPD